MVDFCEYLFVIDDFDVDDLKCFVLRMVFLVVFFFDLVLLISISLILFFFYDLIFILKNI